MTERRRFRSSRFNACASSSCACREKNTSSSCHAFMVNPIKSSARSRFFGHVKKRPTVFRTRSAFAPYFARRSPPRPRRSTRACRTVDSPGDVLFGRGHELSGTFSTQSVTSVCGIRPDRSDHNNTADGLAARRFQSLCPTPWHVVNSIRYPI